MTDPAQAYLEPYAVVEVITPELAKTYLTRVGANRNVKPQWYAKLVNDMKQGNWTVTGQGIGFDLHGELIDGQHRLHAVIESGCTVKMLVVRNLPPAAKQNTDNGQRRSPGDVLKIHGFENTTTLAAIVRGCLNYGGQRNPSHAQVLEYAQAHHEALQPFVKLAGYRSRGRAPVAAAFALASIAGWNDVIEACERLKQLAWSSMGDPVYHLYMMLDRHPRLTPTGRHLYAVQALYLVHQGRDCQQLKQSKKLVHELKVKTRKPRQAKLRAVEEMEEQT